jgi:hypothetical protein
MEVGMRDICAWAEDAAELLRELQPAIFAAATLKEPRVESLLKTFDRLTSQGRLEVVKEPMHRAWEVLTAPAKRYG